jgi:hypothetical protein
VINKAEMPSKWELDELSELQMTEDMNLLEGGAQNKQKALELVKFNMVFQTLRLNGYEELWPGVSGPEGQAREKFETLFLDCLNLAETRLFGHQPKPRMVPFADFVNHHNVFS